MSKAEGKQIVIKFTSELVGDVSTNLLAFSVTGQEHKYVNGPILNKTYEVLSIANHPTVVNALLLTMKTNNYFNNASGKLKVNYDSSKGNLSGRGGAVESFERLFLPTELIATPNPNVEENISVSPFEIVAELKDIEYPKRYAEQGNISVAPFEVSATLIDVEDINP